MKLFFDVETTGLADFNKRARDPSQPHIVQLAALFTLDDQAKAADTAAQPDLEQLSGAH